MPWIQQNVEQVVDAEKAAGAKDIFYAKFDFFEGGYVAYGHPSVATDKKIADEIIKYMEADNLFGLNK